MNFNLRVKTMVRSLACGLIIKPIEVAISPTESSMGISLFRKERKKQIYNLSKIYIITASYKRVILCDSVLLSSINVYLEKEITSQKMTRFSQ